MLTSTCLDTGARLPQLVSLQEMFISRNTHALQQCCAATCFSMDGNARHSILGARHVMASSDLRR